MLVTIESETCDHFKSIGILCQGIMHCESSSALSNWSPQFDSKLRQQLFELHKILCTTPFSAKEKKGFQECIQHAYKCLSATRDQELKVNLYNPYLSKIYSSIFALVMADRSPMSLYTRER